MAFEPNTPYESKATAIGVLTGRALTDLVVWCIREQDFESLYLMQDKGRFRLTKKSADDMTDHGPAFISNLALGHLDALGQILAHASAYDHTREADSISSMVISETLRRWFVSVAKEAMFDLDALWAPRTMGSFDVRIDNYVERRIFHSFQVLSAIALALGEKELLEQLSKRINFSETGNKCLIGSDAIATRIPKLSGQDARVHLSVYGLIFNRPETLSHFNADVFASPVVHIESSGKETSAAEIVLESSVDAKFFDLLERKTRCSPNGYRVADRIDEDWMRDVAIDRPHFVRYLLDQSDSVIDRNPHAWMSVGLMKKCEPLMELLKTRDLEWVSMSESHNPSTDSKNFTLPSAENHPLAAVLNPWYCMENKDCDEWGAIMLRRMEVEIGRSRLVNLRTAPGESILVSAVKMGHVRCLGMLLDWSGHSELPKGVDLEALQSVAQEADMAQCLSMLTAHQARRAAASAMNEIASMRSNLASGIRP